MKKLIAMLMALMLALSCTLALAEGTEVAGFQGKTVESEYEIDRDVLKNALAQLGVNEDVITVVDTVAALFSEMGERAVKADNGIQYELLLKDTPLVTLVVEQTDTGLAVGSSLIPSYYLDVSLEDIGSMMEGMSSKLQGLEELDMDALTDAVTGYSQEFIDACTHAVTTGEPEMGDYVLDGISYNVKVPVNVDLAAIINAANDMSAKLQNDETVKAAIEKLQGMGVNIDIDDSPAGETIDAASLPTVAVDAYMYVDEEGNQSDTVDVVFSVTPADSEEAATIGDVLVEGGSIKMTFQFLTANTNVYFTNQPDETSSVNCRLDIDSNGIYAGLALVRSEADDAKTIDSYVFLMDEENPVFTACTTIRQGGELTLSAAGEGKTAVAIADLTGEKAEDLITSLGMDVLFNGLGGMISTATQLMPEETQAITSLATSLFGGSEEEPAA